MKRLSILLVFSFLIFSCKSRLPLTDFLKREVTVGDKTYGYRVYVPPGRQPGEKLPVMLYLHGSGSRGTDNESQIEGFDAAAKDLMPQVLKLFNSEDAHEGVQSFIERRDGNFSGR